MPLSEVVNEIGYAELVEFVRGEHRANPALVDPHKDRVSLLVLRPDVRNPVLPGRVLEQTRQT